MSNFKIRPCTQEDIDVLVQTIRESFRNVAERFGLTQENAPRHPSNCSREWIEREMARGIRYFVLETQEMVSGCVALEMATPEVCYLERLAVVPDQRRRGYGKALVDHIVFEAKLLGADRVDIGIIVEDTELQAWYRRLGFVKTETKEFPNLPFRVTFMTQNLV